jgi:glycosyltransferase involved in cell wall biosynthesis
MSVLLSHPTGNANVRAVAKGLMDAGCLAEFHTSIASFRGSLLDRIGGMGPFAEIKRRSYETELGEITHTWPWKEVGRLLALKTGLQSLTKHESGFFCIDAVYKALDKKVAAKLKRTKSLGIKAIYAYEDETLLSFRQAKQSGICCLYDLPIGYWSAARKLLQKEIERWPDWVSTMPNFIDSEIKLFRKDEELRLADRIFVASKFTATTLNEFPGRLAPVEIIPYGFPPAVEDKKYSNPSGRKLKLLFVGGLSQRKGIADVFAAVNKFSNHVELTIVGKKLGNDCKALDKALQFHKWIPALPHDRILKLMRENDVLLFPSLFEGFGLVITEAMSQGTPVITTNRTVGPDFIENDKNGWVIEAGTTQALEMAIEKILNKPQMLEQIGRKALATARSRHWELYAQEIAASIKLNLA